MELTRDELFATPVTPTRPLGGTGGFPRVSDQMQATRNAEAAAILEKERAGTTDPTALREIDEKLGKMTSSNVWQTGSDPTNIGGTHRVSLMNQNDSLGSKIEFSKDELFGTGASETKPAPKSKAAEAVDKLVNFQFGKGYNPVDVALGLPAKKRAEDIVGSAGAFMDMFTGVLGGIVRFPAYVGARMGTQAAGAGQQESAEYAGLIAGNIVPPEINSPFVTIAKALGPKAEKAYAESPIGRINEWIGEVLTEGAAKASDKTGVPKEDWMAAADAAMTALGVVGTKAALRKALEGRDKVAIKKALDDAVAEARLRQPEPKPASPTDQIMQDYRREVLEQKPQAAEPLKPTENPLPPVVPDTVSPALAATIETPAWKQALEILQKPMKERTASEAKALRDWEIQAAATGGAVAGLAGLVIADPDRAQEILDMAGGSGKLGAAAAVGMAVKQKGGMWHPDAVERLAAPIREKLLQDVRTNALRDVPPGDTPNTAQTAAYAEAARPIETQVDRWIRNYLNRHAGTETDPLANVEIPFEGGPQKWGELTDLAIRGTEVEGPRGKELQWGMPSSGRLIGGLRNGGLDADAAIQTNAARRAIESYLSHAGDYARQNIPAAKLGQYDLVRLVKETAKRDAEMAAQMEKAALASTKDLPTVREYPDGMRWVELKLPRDLTPEQAKGMRRATRQEENNLGRGNPGTDIASPEVGGTPWVAIDASGKPIENSYTGRPAMGASAKEAYLAGRLAEEGNQMGHCVGGYCAGVAAGESRIFSLRDAKGKSHVTIETMPEGRRVSDNAGGVIPLPAESISQIKGKQNRAPNAEYLPYVQDFVRNPPEGKAWGEVGDIENTGLHRAKGSDVEYNALTNRMFPGKEWLTQQEVLALNQAARAEANTKLYDQRGSATTDLLARLGLGTAGAVAGMALGDENPVYSAILGGLAGAALPSLGGFGKSAATNVGAGFNLISRTLYNKNPAVWFRAETYEMNLGKRTAAAEREIAPFVRGYRALDDVMHEDLKGALLENNMNRVVSLAARTGDVELAKNIGVARKVLDSLGDEALALRIIGKKLPEYFPRRIADYPGFRKATDQDTLKGIDRALADADLASLDKSGRPMLEIERDIVINNYLMRPAPVSGQAGFAKPRTVREVIDRYKQFYEDPADTLQHYIREAVEQIETAKFFGKDLATVQKGATHYPDITKSIGNIVGREREAGRLDADGVVELNRALHSRFGIKDSPKYIQDIKNLGYIGTIGDLMSTLTQFGDIPINIVNYGWVPTISAVAQLLNKSNKLSAADFGIVGKIGEEFTSTARTAKWLNTVLRTEGFTWVDALGKNVSLNTPIIEFQRLVKNPAGIKKLEALYGKALGEEFPQLVHDLQNKDVTPLVESVAYASLSKVQPINRLEIPEGYANNPNARIMYMLHTYQLKQLDIVRREAFDKFRNGEKVAGINYLIKYATLMGISGATIVQIQNWILGRDHDLALSDVPINMVKNLGLSQYVLDQLKEGNLKNALTGIAMPPIGVVQDIIAGGDRAASHIPWIGRITSNRFMGGAEKYNMKNAKTPEAKADAKEAYRQKIGEEAFEQEREARRLKRVKRELEAQAQ